MRQFFTFYANDTSAYNPTLWAMESISLLWERMVAGNLVNVDHSDAIANFGDTVNTRKVNKFVGKRKDPTDNVTVQDAVATNYSVKLNQLPHVSFSLNDSEMSKSFKDLVAEFLDPAIGAMAKMIDQIILGQMSNFVMTNTAGRLGNMSSSTVKGDLLNARKIMNDNLVPDNNRNMLWNTRSETFALQTDLFIAANQRGDGGTALENAALGRVLGFNNYMTQHMPSVPATTKVAGAINFASGYAVGTKTFTVNSFSAAIAAGSFITIAGDDTPLRVVSTVGGATPTSITVQTGIKQAVANSAVVTVYTPGSVNFAGGYAIGYSKAILITAAIFPSVGQLVTFKTNATDPVYMIIQADSTAGTITLDRPLEVAIANTDAVNLGPAGDYSFGFERDAIMLVNRPLATPLAGTGALSQVVSANNFSIRATITYNGLGQYHLVTLDTLLGVALRDINRGVVLLG